MSKLHTAVITNEPASNIRVCGFGSGGRLGPGQHTLQYSFQPLHSSVPSLSIASTALGQDHTLVLTISGEVFSWGLNRFAQLGYVVEVTGPFTQEPIQATPRRIMGALRKETVGGIAAAKTCSACWTAEEVYTWGTNSGQLGYDQPVQVLPRKVTWVSRVVDVALSDTAMACLLQSRDVVLLCNYQHTKLSFPTAFPSEIQPYRPPQAIKNAHISKIATSDGVFGALSSNGEVFTFRPPPALCDGKERTGAVLRSDPKEKLRSDIKERGGKSANVLPLRVWALRKQFTAIRDFALGADGSIILCTESGHVFVGSQTGKGGQVGPQAGGRKPFKYTRLPYIQRVTQVCANISGAFAAIRVDAAPKPIAVHGNTLAQDMAHLQPYMVLPDEEDRFPGWRPTSSRARGPVYEVDGADGAKATTAHEDEHEEDEDDGGIVHDLYVLRDICVALIRQMEARKVYDEAKDEQGKDSDKDKPGRDSDKAEHAQADSFLNMPRGADMLVRLPNGDAYPVHSVVLAARSTVLRDILSSSRAVDSADLKGLHIDYAEGKARSATQESAVPALEIRGCHALTVLILLRYLYTDDLLAVWDPRIATGLGRIDGLGLDLGVVKPQLRALAQLLDLPKLARALESPAKRVPEASLASDLRALYAPTNGFTLSKEPNALLRPDVVLQFKDREVTCHSAVLRCRTDYFAAFFDEAVWTERRKGEEGAIVLDMRPFRWEVMQYVLKYVYCGEHELFGTFDFAHNVDELIDFIFEVISAANELLLHRLVLVCSEIILRHVNVNNACFILAEATHYHVAPLVESLQGYIAVNMETFLESRMLDDLSPDLITELATFVRQKQVQRLRLDELDAQVARLMAAHADWLATQDVAEPIIPSNRARKDSAKMSPSASTKILRKPPSSPTLGAQVLTSSASGNDDIFEMDDAVPPFNIGAPPPPATTPASSSRVWKTPNAPRVDMKSLMAEAENQAKPSMLAESSGKGSLRGTPKEWRRLPLQDTPPRTPPARTPGMPWRIPSSSTPPAGSSSLDFPTPGVVPQLSSAFPPVERRPSQPTPSAQRKVPPSPPRPGKSFEGGLGPVYTPAKQSPAKMRATSSAAAWTSPPVEPVTAPSTGMSFAAIQQAQQDQSAPVRDKRSLKEIQEEERDLQAEADFLVWWTAEEERLRVEAEAVSAALVKSKKEGGKKRRGPGPDGQRRRPSGQDNPSAGQQRQMGRPQDGERSEGARQESQGQRPANATPPSKPQGRRPKSKQVPSGRSAPPTSAS
ncbi:uncharacterized protein SCHCODRAFT_02620198 [Schizophyllum commune H4-8]|uniref:uncharacterized protein n=1 Tax=Schizophyllum commune (strain H4-8 / FGSC 9210) TaxID=578458 RepID=UPI00216033AB|nr:uncharacterized protein SCHCODRAFT_02620198 [Schizophyllum commune H4-8]KAI5895724.1 hypothetical protein SCHCODRAFT_02620198 [Schizophyllum commune H4-8]